MLLTGSTTVITSKNLQATSETEKEAARFIMTRDPESGVLQLKAGDETVNVTSQALQYNSFTQQDIDRGLYNISV